MCPVIISNIYIEISFTTLEMKKEGIANIYFYKPTKPEDKHITRAITAIGSYRYERLAIDSSLKYFWRWCCITAIYSLDFIHRLYAL
jgi:hypothetical protein